MTSYISTKYVTAKKISKNVVYTIIMPYFIRLNRIVRRYQGGGGIKPIPGTSNSSKNLAFIELNIFRISWNLIFYTFLEY